MPETLTGTYENFIPGITSVFGNTFQLERLILRTDSSFTFYTYNDEGDYKTSHCRSGHWTIVEDSIQLTTADTIPPEIIYKQDHSGKLTLEFYDQFGSPYIQPVTVIFKGNHKSQFTRVNYGVYKKKLPNDYNGVQLSKQFAGKKNFLIPLKRDSMHIQVYGLNMSHAKIFEVTRLAKKDSILQGSTYVVNRQNKGYVPVTLYQKRQFKYYKWEQ